MTVGELIAKLAKCDNRLNVCVLVNGWHPEVTDVELTKYGDVEIKHK